MSLNNLLVDGIVNAGNGQFGATVIDTLPADITLWTAYPNKPYRYELVPDSATRTVTLPLIGSILTPSIGSPIDLSKALIGNELFIINNSQTENLVVVSNDGSIVSETLTPNEAARFIAISASNTWDVIRLLNPSITSIANDQFIVYNSSTPAWENRSSGKLIPGANITFSPALASWDPLSGVDVTIASAGGGGGGSLTTLTGLGGLTLTPDPWTTGAAFIETDSQTVYNNDPATNITLGGASGTYRIQDGGLTGSLFVVENTGGTLQYLDIEDDSVSIGANSNTSGTSSITIGIPSTAVTTSANNALTLIADSTGGTVSKDSRITKVASEGEILTSSLDGSGVDLTKGNMLTWVAKSVTTTGSTGAAFTETLEMPMGHTALLTILLNGTNTGAGGGTAGESWVYKLIYRIKNIGGTITVTSAIVATIEEPAKQVTNPLSISLTDPLVFTVTQSALTTEVLQWVLAAEVVYNKFV